MSRWLLAAEADQIQDFIFRAARLREVAGGSQLLARLCDDAGEGGLAALKKYYPSCEPIINDGGAFLLAFDDEAQAVACGRALAALYRRCAGGNLTVAKPVPYDVNDFSTANDLAKKELRRAKSRGDAPGTTPHLPYTAFCASCGLALARYHRAKREHADDPNERANYLCADCAYKAAEQKEQNSKLLDDFCRDVLPKTKDTEGLLPAPLKGDWAETVGQLDPRHYVAYLVADGNGMGKVFDKCEHPDQMRALSKAMTGVLRRSLATPCTELLETQRIVAELGTMPVLPLIVGGDDLFALLPARWALDYARRFCVQYEIELSQVLARPEINLSGLSPAISAVVVICKSTYPHTLAYRRAKAELKRVKEMTRRIEADNSQLRLSAMSFVVISGNQAVGHTASETQNKYRPTLRPYFVTDDAPENYGFNVARLCRQRKALKDVPNKRRAELESLYEEIAAQAGQDDLPAGWLQELTEKRLRLRQRNTQEAADKLDSALTELGASEQTNDGFWKSLYRPGGENWYGHGLPDLLAAWDFAYLIDVPLSEYEGA